MKIVFCLTFLLPLLVLPQIASGSNDNEVTECRKKMFWEMMIPRKYYLTLANGDATFTILFRPTSTNAASANAGGNGKGRAVSVAGNKVEVGVEDDNLESEEFDDALAYLIPYDEAAREECTPGKFFNDVFKAAVDFFPGTFDIDWDDTAFERSFKADYVDKMDALARDFLGRYKDEIFDDALKIVYYIVNDEKYEFLPCNALYLKAANIGPDIPGFDEVYTCATETQAENGRRG